MKFFALSSIYVLSLNNLKYDPKTLKIIDFIPLKQ